MHLFLWVLLMLVVPATARAQRPPLEHPNRDELVVETLPRGYAALRPSINPRASAEPLVAAEQLLRLAGSTGDARLATRADALLATLPTPGSVRVRKARAFSAQHRHDFALSARLLDSIIRDDARDADARLARAQLDLVQGRLRAARKGCAALAITVDSDYGSTCIAAWALRTGGFDSAARLVDRWLSQPRTDPGFRRFMLVMRGEIASRAGDRNAEKWFKQALIIAPDDVRTLSAYARHLAHERRWDRVLELLTNAPKTDGLQLHQALAAHALQRPEAAALAAAQARRYALAREVGVEPELRDEAEVRLTLLGQAPSALELAQRNFASQRDFEDVDLLQRAALAAGRPEALDELRRWAVQEGLALAMPEAEK